MLMTPAQLHISFEVLFSAGMFFTSTVGLPGAQGAVVTGTQGIGVRTPRAADVAAATIGLARLWHIPKGGMLTIGLLSMMFAAGMLDVRTILSGSTTRVDGARPNVHCIMAPMQTCCPIA